MITIDNKNFGRTAVGETKTGSLEVENNSSVRQFIASFLSDNPVFVPETTSFELQPKFPLPVGTLIYFDSEGEIQNPDGSFITENKGFGIAGEVLSELQMTKGIVPFSISLTEPLEGQIVYINSLFTAKGETTLIPDGETVNLWAKKVGGTEDVSLGTAVVSSGQFEKSDCVLTDTLFDIGDFVEIRAVRGSVASNVRTVEIEEVEMTDIAGFSYEEGNFLVGEEEDFIIYDD